MKSEKRFRDAQVVVRITNGEVILKGSLVGYHDPSILKHKVAENERVAKIEIGVAFLT